MCFILILILNLDNPDPQPLLALLREECLMPLHNRCNTYSTQP